MSVVLAIIALFIAVIVGYGLYFIVWALDKRKFRLDNMRHILDSFAMASYTLSGKVLTGFAHAYIDNAEFRMVLLLVGSLWTLAITAKYSYAYTVEPIYWVCMCALFGRVLLNVVLLVEICFSLGMSLSPREEILSKFSCILIYLLLGFCVLGYLINVTIGLRESLRKLFKQPSKLRASNQICN